MKPGTAQNPIPELPRYLRGAFNKPGGRFARLHIIYETERPNIPLRAALIAHMFRTLIPELAEQLDHLKGEARAVQLRRIMSQGEKHHGRPLTNLVKVEEP